MSRINKACDGCRVRKVKCNGELPCSQCAHLDLPCHFSPPSGKRKPGVRNRLVDQLREKSGHHNQLHHQNQSNHDGGGGNIAAQQHQFPQGSYPYHHAPQPHCASSSTAGLSGAAAPPPAVTSVAGIINAAEPATTPAHITSPSGTSNSSTPTTAGGGGPEYYYTADFFLSLIPDYESIVYPVSPIITADELRAAIASMHATHQDAALVYGFAAVTINLSQTSSWTLVNGDVAAQAHDLMQRSLVAHRLADLGPGPGPARRLGELSINVKRVMTCIFLEITMMAFRLFQRSFVILREAISLVQSFKVHRYTAEDHHSNDATNDDHDPSAPRRASSSCTTTTTLDRAEVARRQRLYWECFIHERFVNIMSGCPSVLPPLSSGLPLHDTTIPPHVDLGFRHLISLFSVMDDSFLSHWNAQQDPRRPVTEAMTAQWIESKQAELDRHEAETTAEDERLRVAAAAASTGHNADMASTRVAGLTELQHADIFITRLWLRTLVWQLALSNGLLRSAPPQTAHQGLSLHFPARRLSAQLRGLVSRLGSVASIGTHGSGILQKLFEITTTVADVLALPPGQATGEEGDDVRARVEDFLFLVSFLFRFERISREERDYMREKLEVLQQIYTAVDFGSLAVSSV
ncbi:Transcription factor-like protein [Hapsidospora chrysogenum ATCC 11550]|uniref:Transcription factor-like protein n=1 Tax=Hapsidospora chrysogenum (strain ATCC 11550 / CBS 779.69 / DSM 880 / IAM 14645 / JCM 23072 / IMI 49137) TaxID=857340 RepID=A0A086T8A9_HAPC1|nr:Transcription factor-like protein [Hapsidospora chrysogenum ATCC 11550]